MPADSAPSFAFSSSAGRGAVACGLWRMSSWQRSDAESAAWLQSVMELGIETFDLADVYGSYLVEGLFGRALAAAPGLRDRLKIVTKCDIRIPSPQRPANSTHTYDTSRAYILEAVETSLRDLGTDRIDLLLLHRQDPLMDPDEVASAFDELEASGKVLAFGVSNFTPTHLSMLASRVRQPLATNQVEASVLRLDAFLDGTFDQCLERRVTPMAWSPVGGGRLFAGADEQARSVHAALARIAEEHHVAPDVIAYAFLNRHPVGAVPITGSSKLERIEHAVRALEVTLTRDEWFELWRAAGGPMP